MKKLIAVIRILILGLVTALWTQINQSYAQNSEAFRLNPDLVFGGNVSEYAISPNGKWVVYRADQDTDNVGEVYSIPIRGGEAVKLNPDLAGSKDISNFAISPDSSRVVYHGDQDTDTVRELYSVPIEGGTAVKLNDSLALGRDIDSDFQITPDGTRVLFVADQNADNLFELFSVPIAGGTVVKHNPTPDIGGDVETDFQISPDSTRVVYRGNLSSAAVDLYSVPIAGGTVVNLSSVSVYDVKGGFQISPDGNRVVFRHGYRSAGISAPFLQVLYSVPIVGGSKTLLSSTSESNQGTEELKICEFMINANSSDVVFTAEENVSGFSPNCIGDSIFSAPIIGGTRVLLREGGVGSTFRRMIQQFDIAIDGSRVVYLRRSRQISAPTNTQALLYSVEMDGTGFVKISPDIFGTRDAYGFQLSPDGTNVVYWAEYATDHIIELFTSPIVGGAFNKLNDDLVSGGDVGRFDQHLNSDRVLVSYLANQDNANSDELYTVPLSGGEVAKLNRPIDNHHDVISFEIGRDSKHVVYLASENSSFQKEIFAVDISEAQEDSDLCWPIKSTEGTAVICL